MSAIPPEFEFQGTVSKLRKRNKISSLLVYVLHKTRNLAFSRRSREKTAKKCTKKCAARAKLLFCLLTFRRTSKFIPPPWYKEWVGWNPLPGVFDMLQYFETILPLVESL